MFTSLIGVLIAVIVCCSATNLPSQVRIALAGTDSSGNSNGMSISWSTETKPITSTVKYGKVSTQYDLQSIGKSVSYWETYHSHVILSELEPNTKYYYIVGDDTDGWSKEYSFNSAPLTSQLRGNFSFAVFADLGAVNGDPTNVYIDSIKNDVDLVWHGGDVGYADDSFLHKDCVFDFCYENAFDTYLQNVESWTSQLPYMVCVGNHEAGKSFSYITFMLIVL